MDKSGPKNNSFWSLTWKSGTEVFNLSAFATFTKLVDVYNYIHKANKVAAKCINII